MSQIQHIAALWSALHYPSEESEWSVERKIHEAKATGFDGVASMPREGLRDAIKNYDMPLIGYMAVGHVSQFADAIRANLDAGSQLINVHLGSGDTLTPEALGLTMLLLEEGRRQGADISIEVHRATCTETPEKTYALADDYEKITGELIPLTWDFSHLAVVKHLHSGNYADQLLVRPELVQRARLFHLRPFNGHHCQIPVTDGRGNLTQELKEYLVFVEAVLTCWLSHKDNAGRQIFAVPPRLPVGRSPGRHSDHSPWCENETTRLSRWKHFPSSRCRMRIKGPSISIHPPSSIRITDSKAGGRFRTASVLRSSKTPSSAHSRRAVASASRVKRAWANRMAGEEFKGELYEKT